MKEKNGKKTKMDLPKKNCLSDVRITGFFYYADKLKVKEGKYGRYVSFCIVQEKRGERGRKKVYLPVRFFSDVEKIEKIRNLSFVEVEGVLSSYFGMFIKGRKITVVEEYTDLSFSIDIGDMDVIEAVLRDDRRHSAAEDMNSMFINRPDAERNKERDKAMNTEKERKKRNETEKPKKRDEEKKGGDEDKAVSPQYKAPTEKKNKNRKLALSTRKPERFLCIKKKKESQLNEKVRRLKDAKKQNNHD
jgi:hypothetical protein